MSLSTIIMATAVTAGLIVLILAIVGGKFKGISNEEAQRHLRIARRREVGYEKSG